MKRGICALLACVMAALICMPLSVNAASDEKTMVSHEVNASYDNRMGAEKPGESVLLAAESNENAGRILLAAVLAMFGGAVGILNRGKKEEKD